MQSDERFERVARKPTLYSAFKRAGLPDVTPQVCRKTFGTKLLNNDIDLVTIQHSLGRASLKTT